MVFCVCVVIVSRSSGNIRGSVLSVLFFMLIIFSVKRWGGVIKWYICYFINKCRFIVESYYCIDKEYCYEG